MILEAFLSTGKTGYSVAHLRDKVKPPVDSLDHSTSNLLLMILADGFRVLRKIFIIFTIALGEGREMNYNKKMGVRCKMRKTHLTTKILKITFLFWSLCGEGFLIYLTIKSSNRQGTKTQDSKLLRR